MSAEHFICEYISLRGGAFVQECSAEAIYKRTAPNGSVTHYCARHNEAIERKIAQRRIQDPKWDNPTQSGTHSVADAVQIFEAHRDLMREDWL